MYESLFVLLNLFFNSSKIFLLKVSLISTVASLFQLKVWKLIVILIGHYLSEVSIITQNENDLFKLFIMIFCEEYISAMIRSNFQPTEEFLKINTILVQSIVDLLLWSPQVKSTF